MNDNLFRSMRNRNPLKPDLSGSEGPDTTTMTHPNLRLGSGSASFVLAMVLLLVALPVRADQTEPAEQLIVLVQPEASELAKTFQAEHLPKLEALAGEMGLDFIVKDVSEGPLPGVGITPLVVFQNHRGRSIYQGRYTTLDRVRNFVQTSRFMPQGDEKRKIEDAIGMRDGRSTVVLPLKVTDLVGAPPEDYSHPTFIKEIRTAFKEKPMKPSGPLGDVALGRSDRLFYVDLYPYRSEDGTLYLSMAVFSQFHCHEPVFTTGNEPIAAPWDQRGQAISEAVVLANNIVREKINTSAIGDGFNVIAADRASVSWEDFGLPLPPKPANAVNVDPASIVLSREWTVDVAAQQQRPAVQFGFGAPLEMYSGQATELTGQLTLGEGLSLADASGKFVVPIKAVTMGEPALDLEIFGWLAGKKHPDSDFTFDRIETSESKLVFGQVIPGVLVGQFTMKGMTIDLSVPVSIEAILGSDGQPRVTIDGRWTIDITNPFGVAGPDGPEDVASTLIYRCHIVLAPAA